MFAENAAAQTGAKRFFLTPRVAVELRQSRRRVPTLRNRPGPEAGGADAAGVNAGLMYYIERQGPDGRVDRVNPTTIFHSGDRIRLQLKSNVAGRLVIAQRNPDGSSGVLFPDSRVNGGDNRIQANTVSRTALLGRVVPNLTTIRAKSVSW